jgi:PII-like signaling protein
MKGFQITFFTQQDRRYHGKPLADWLVHLAKDMGMTGATLVAAAEGFGHARRIHSARFFDLADQPLEVTIIASEEDTARLLERLRSEGLDIFYAKTPVEFGHTGGNA